MASFMAFLKAEEVVHAAQKFKHLVHHHDDELGPALVRPPATDDEVHHEFSIADTSEVVRAVAKAKAQLKKNEERYIALLSLIHI